MGSGGMHAVRRPFFSLSWILTKTVTNQPRPPLAAKTPVNVEDTVEKSHNINEPLFTDTAEDTISGSTPYPTVLL